MRLYVGVDVGGTTSTIAIGNEKRHLIYVSDQFSTRSSEGPAVTIEDITQQIVGGLERCGASLADVAKVCLATPGPATLDGILLATPNLRADLWNRYPIRQGLQDRLRTSRRGLKSAMSVMGKLPRSASLPSEAVQLTARDAKHLLVTNGSRNEATCNRCFCCGRNGAWRGGSSRRQGCSRRRKSCGTRRASALATGCFSI